MVAEGLYHRAYTAHLGNGLRILIEENPQSRSVSIGTWIAVGSRDDSTTNPGLAHFIEHLAFKGTATRDAAQISRAIDSVGGSLNAATGRESTVFYADVPADGMSTALDLLADLVLHPAFASEKIDLERTVVLDEIRGHQDDPEAMAFDQFIAAVWGDDHPLSRPVLGTKRGIESVAESSISDYHQRNYRPTRMVVAAAGAVDAETVINQVSARFGAVATEQVAGGERVAPQFRSERNHYHRTTGQTHIYLALPGPATGDPDRYALEVVNVLLGDGTSSRLFRAVREDRGLAYSVGSTVMRYTDGGLWMLYAGTSPKLAPQVRDLLERELVSLREQAPDEAEIALAKARLRGLFILGMESNANRAMRLGTAAITGREIHAPDQVLARLEAVSSSDVKAVIERFLQPERLHVTTVGPDL